MWNGLLAALGGAACCCVEHTAATHCHTVQNLRGAPELLISRTEEVGQRKPSRSSCSSSSTVSVGFYPFCVTPCPVICWSAYIAVDGCVGVCILQAPYRSSLPPCVFWLRACASMVTRSHACRLLWWSVKASALGPTSREGEGKALCNPHSVAGVVGSRGTGRKSNSCSAVQPGYSWRNHIWTNSLTNHWATSILYLSFISSLCSAFLRCHLFIFSLFRKPNGQTGNRMGPPLLLGWVMALLNGLNDQAHIWTDLYSSCIPWWCTTVTPRF